MCLWQIQNDWLRLIEQLLPIRSDWRVFPKNTRFSPLGPQLLRNADDRKFFDVIGYQSKYWSLAAETTKSCNIIFNYYRSARKLFDFHWLFIILRSIYYTNCLIMNFRKILGKLYDRKKPFMFRTSPVMIYHK